MNVQEFGTENEKTIVLLHGGGAHIVHTFGKQFPLAQKYHILIPHIMGFGDHADQVFQTEACLKELSNLIKSLGKKVVLVGFSLGAQLAFQLVTTHEELFDCAVFISPWLVHKEADYLSEYEAAKNKEIRLLKNRFICHLIGVLNGFSPKIRKESVAQWQAVQPQTIHNVVYNGIALETSPDFSNVSIPMIALAGEKEEAKITDTVKKMAQLNPNCSYDIWQGAGHNIPMVFSEKLNRLISDLVKPSASLTSTP